MLGLSVVGELLGLFVGSCVVGSKVGTADGIGVVGELVGETVIFQLSTGNHRPLGYHI